MQLHWPAAKKATDNTHPNGFNTLFQMFILQVTQVETETFSI